MANLGSRSEPSGRRTLTLTKGGSKELIVVSLCISRHLFSNDIRPKSSGEALGIAFLRQAYYFFSDGIMADFSLV